MVTLSVIIITRNEEDNIAEVIQSCMKGASQTPVISSFEIILVDSNSSDRTVEIANKFPITILQLDEQHIGIAAGRNVGYKYANGDYLLFIDGDMILHEDFLSKAIEYMQEKRQIAGVVGQVSQFTRDRTLYMKYPDPSVPGGAVLYRKSVLDDIGPFDPWLQGEEDRELSFRIRQKNREICLLDTPMVGHKVKKEKTSPVRRFKYYQGVGQLLKRYWGTPLVKELLKWYWFHVFLLGWTILALPTAFLSLFKLLDPILWKMFLLSSLLGYGIVISYSKLKVGRSVSIATRKLIANFFESFGILVGCIKRRRDVVTYPPARLLKKGYIIFNVKKGSACARIS